MPPKKEFTFVLRTQDDDEAAHKKQLKSVINTHVAFRAHEQRRERKKRNSKATESSQTRSSTSSKPNLPSELADSSPHDDIKQEQFAQQLVAVDSSRSVVANKAVFSDASTVRKQLNALYSDQKNLEASIDESMKIAKEDQRRQRRSSALIPLGISRSVTGWSNSAGTSLNDNPLDPFIRLPIELSTSEQSFIRYWYTDAQTLMFGVDANAPFCPLRDWSFQNVQLHDIALTWVLISAEQHLSRMRQEGPSSSLLRRRAQGYAALNDILNKPKVDLDKAYVGIIMAIVADSILGRHDLLKMHVKGLDLLLQERGGIHSLLENPLAALPPFCVMMQYTYAECDIQTLRELETIKTRFMRTMRGLRVHSMKMRSILRSARVLPETSRPDHDENSPENLKRVEDYAALKKDVFFDCSIGSIIWALYDPSTSYSQKSGHFMILLSLGLTFVFFGTQHVVKTIFLKRLKFIAERVSAFDPHTGTSLLLPAQFASMISHVRQEVQGHFDNQDEVLEEEVKACAITIDGLKMFGYLGEANRAQLIDLLRDWLFVFKEEETGPPDQEHERDSEVLAAMSAEIVETWYQNQSKKASQTSPMK